MKSLAKETRPCQQTSSPCSRSARCPGTAKASILPDYPGYWAEARRLAGLDWDPVTTEVYAVTSINDDGTFRYEPIAGLEVDQPLRHRSRPVDQPRHLHRHRPRRDGRDRRGRPRPSRTSNGKPRASWTAAAPSGAWPCSMSPSPCPATTAPRCPTWPSPTGTTAPARARCAPPPSGSSAPTPSAPPNSKASAPAPPSPSSTRPGWRDRIDDARKAVTGAQAEMRRYTELASELLGIPVTPAQRELFIIVFIPKPPRRAHHRPGGPQRRRGPAALRLLFDSPTTEPGRHTFYSLSRPPGSTSITSATRGPGRPGSTGP